jgi:hypothetical protein
MYCRLERVRDRFGRVRVYTLGLEELGQGGVDRGAPHPLLVARRTAWALRSPAATYDLAVPTGDSTGGPAIAHIRYWYYHDRQVH